MGIRYFFLCVHTKKKNTMDKKDLMQFNALMNRFPKINNSNIMLLMLFNILQMLLSLPYDSKPGVLK